MLVWEDLQVACQRIDVSGLNGNGRCQLILDSQIGTHVVGRLVIKLDATQPQTGGDDNRGSKGSARKTQFRKLPIRPGCSRHCRVTSGCAIPRIVRILENIRGQLFGVD